LVVQQGNPGGLWRLNSPFFTLIPKQTEASRLGDFRPISLVHSFSKLITKILANRLAPKLDKMVSPNQSAFIKDRCIHDNFLMVNQTVKMLQKKGTPSLFLKLHIKKAFDSICWAFLMEVLQHLGFGQIWCNLVLSILSSSSTQISVNEEPRQSIKHKRGLRA
jgi:hypothetical protein